MKTCPICHARCFDDMSICFGCMHRFSDDVPNQETDTQETDAQVIGTQSARAQESRAEAVAERIELLNPTADCMPREEVEEVSNTASHVEDTKTPSTASSSITSGPIPIQPGYKLIITLVPAEASDRALTS